MKLELQVHTITRHKDGKRYVYHVDKGYAWECFGNTMKKVYFKDTREFNEFINKVL
jgi:hypothetical protein